MLVGKSSRYILSGLFLVLFFTSVPESQAQPTTNPPALPEIQESGEATISFEELGFSGRSLQGGAESVRLFFTLPADWILLEEARVILDLQVLIRNAIGGFDGEYGGLLQVSVNGITAATFILQENGSQIFSISIPDEVIASPPADKRYRLDIVLRDPNSGCGVALDVLTSVLIQPTSRFILPYRVTEPTTVLSRLPYPIYQQSFQGDEAVVVIPNNPTPEQLQAAFTAGAAFGRMARNLNLSLIPVSKLTAEIRETKHLIVVGELSEFASLQELSLSRVVLSGELDERRFLGGHLPLDETIPLSRDEEIAGALAEDAGLIYMTVSPWNKTKVVLVVGGYSEAAAIKAAQALGSGLIRTGKEPNLALVNDINSGDAAGQPSGTTYTLADQSDGLQILKAPGETVFNFYFFIPPGQTFAVDDEAVINIIFNHSALLDYEASGLVLELNNVPIGSVRFSDESTVLSERQFPISASAIVPGTNVLTFHAILEVPGTCNQTLEEEGGWLTIYPESSLFLPLSEPTEATSHDLKLNNYPEPFIFGRGLERVAFVLSESDPVAWNAAMLVAFDLGKEAKGSIFDLRVAYANNIAESIRLERDLIVVGRASQLPIIQELGEALPGNFLPGSDRVVDERLSIDYALPATISSGYLELISAPWDNNRVVLAILGNSDEGLGYALSTLLAGNERRKLTGDLAVIEGGQLYVTSSRTVSNEEMVAENSGANSSSLKSGEETFSQEKPQENVTGIDGTSAEIAAAVEEAPPALNSNLVESDPAGESNSDPVLSQAPLNASDTLTLEEESVGVNFRLIVPITVLGITLTIFGVLLYKNEYQRRYSR